MPKHLFRSLAVVAAAAAAIPVAAATPASAGPACGPLPISVKTDQPAFVGSDCAEIITVGPNTQWVDARGGDDAVIVHSGTATIWLGTGNDDYIGWHDPGTTVHGGLGNDDLRSLVDPVAGSRSGYLLGEAGNDDLLALDGSWLNGGYDDDTLEARGSSGCGSSTMNDNPQEVVPYFVSSKQHCTILMGGSGSDTLTTSDHHGDATRLSAWVSGGNGSDHYNVSQPVAFPHRTDRIYEATSEGPADWARYDSTDYVSAYVETKVIDD